MNALPASRSALLSQPFATRHAGSPCDKHETCGAPRVCLILRHRFRTILELSLYTAIAKQAQSRSAWPSMLLAYSTLSQKRCHASGPCSTRRLPIAAAPIPVFCPSQHPPLPDVQGRIRDRVSVRSIRQTYGSSSECRVTAEIRSPSRILLASRHATPS